jgi:hypothetical protein
MNYDIGKEIARMRDIGNSGRSTIDLRYAISTTTLQKYRRELDFQTETVGSSR